MSLLSWRFSSRGPALLALGVLVGSTAFVLGCPGFGSGESFDAAGADPCEQVLALMDAKCNECHSASPSGGAPGYLRTDVLEDVGGVLGASSVHQRILLRMEQQTMPPEGGNSPGEIAVIEAWIALGAPTSCGDGSGQDAGAGADVDAGTDASADSGVDADVNPADGGTDTGAGTDAGTEPTAVSPELQAVSDRLFRPSCNQPGCHDSRSMAGGLPLDGDLLDVRRRLLLESLELAGMPNITPGDLNNSYLWLKVTDQHLAAGGIGSRMPTSGPAPQAGVDALRAWIEAGAP